jgi:hypothetical protein
MLPIAQDDMCGMPEYETTCDCGCCLPPLILHPFSTPSDASTLLSCSRASELLHGASMHASRQAELERRVLEGRDCELRMLFYIGKDVVRWAEQCMDSVTRDSKAWPPQTLFQSFIALLTDTPPPNVTSKLRKWGVVDFRRVFSRAVGLNSVFSELPRRETLTSEFLREYYRYAEHMHSCRQSTCAYARLDPQNIRLEVYASGEYADLLERGLT